MVGVGAGASVGEGCRGGCWGSSPSTARARRVRTVTSMDIGSSGAGTSSRLRLLGSLRLLVFLRVRLRLMGTACAEETGTAFAVETGVNTLTRFALR